MQCIQRNAHHGDDLMSQVITCRGFASAAAGAAIAAAPTRADSRAARLELLATSPLPDELSHCTALCKIEHESAMSKLIMSLTNSKKHLFSCLISL